MNDVFADGQSEVTTDGARNSFQRVGSAVQLTNSFNSIFTTDYCANQRSAGDEVNQFAEEGFAFMLSIVEFSLCFRNFNQFQSSNFQTFVFETSDDVTNQVFSNAVGFYQYQIGRASCRERV